MKLRLILLPLSLILARIIKAQQDKETCAPILDLVFILDTSGSIEEIYSEHVRWTVSLAEALPINKEAVRVSTIQYAGYPLTEFSLDKYKSKSDVVKHLREMSFQSGVTRTGFALRRAEDEIFNEKRGARKNATKVIALFTDGLSIDDPIKASDYLRHKKGVKIYVVSVNAEGFIPEMQRIAGENANVYGPNDLSSLKKQLLRDVDSSRTCESNIAYPNSTQAAVVTRNRNLPNSKKVQDLTSKTNNQRQKKKTRRVLRRKLKRISKKSKKETMAKTTAAPKTTHGIQSSVKRTQNLLGLKSKVLASNLVNTVAPTTSTSNGRAFAAPLAFSSKKHTENVIPLPKCPLDILFIVDSSGSVGKIYEKQKEFLSNILLSIEPKKQNHRVALIQFAGAKLQKTEWTFDSYHENSQLMKAFHRVRHFTGTTYIGAALNLASQLLERRRLDVPTLVILISDGFSQDNAIQSAEVIRAMENVEFYVVSLSQYSNSKYLRKVVKDEEKMLMDKDVTFFANHLKSRLYCENQ